MPMALRWAVIATLIAAAFASADHVPVRARGGMAYKAAVAAEEQFHHERGFRRNTSENWFLQQVDHNDPSKGTFRQRYYYDLGNYSGNGLAQLYIAGEGPVGGSVSGYPADFGRSMGAAMVTVEHRYYGQSMPGPLTDKALLMSTLNVEQAMADFVAFLDYFDRTVLGRKATWYVVGGSYSGGLSAWLKEKYPDRFVAAWSSSGVTHPRFDFWAFDNHVEEVISPKCTAAIRNAFSIVTDAWQDPVQRSKVLATFGTPAYFSLQDMQWMMADGTAMAVQYGHKSHMCNSILPIGPDPLQQYAQIIKELWGDHFTASCYYSSKCLADPSMSDQWAAAGYSWVWQCCGQLSWWQVGYPTSLRPEGLTTDYYVNQCRQAFEPSTIGDIYAFNAKYGGAHPKATHVIALQGSDDPWQTAGVRESLGPLYPYVLAQCDGCGHCGDLMAPKPTDAASLVTQRRKIASYMSSWITAAMARRRD